MGMSKAVNAEARTTTICVEEEPAYKRWKTEYTHRERERHKKLSPIKSATVTNDNQLTFTKGYKVTLYSDSLRATALYSIYINSLRLGLSKGSV